MSEFKLTTVEEFEAATARLLETGAKVGADAWQIRAKNQTPHCKFGEQGICCRICAMGPCRITPKAPRGICASEGVGLGHEFLRHIERTRVIIHIVDAASVEGRDPVEDIHKINKELEAYNPEIAARPQVIAANKIDCIFDDGEESPIDRLKAEFEPQGISVYPISAVTGQGVRELLFHVKELLDKSPMKPVVFEQEFFPEDVLVNENLPFTVERSEEDPEVFLVEGPKIEKMLGYTNLDSEKGFAFFQRFLKEGGILEELEKAGIQEGDTVRMYGFDFDYYK